MNDNDNKTNLSIIIILLFVGSNQVVSDITEIHNTLTEQAEKSQI